MEVFIYLFFASFPCNAFGGLNVSLFFFFVIFLAIQRSHLARQQFSESSFLRDCFFLHLIPPLHFSFFSFFFLFASVGENCRSTGTSLPAASACPSDLLDI